MFVGTAWVPGIYIVVIPFADESFKCVAPATAVVTFGVFLVIGVFVGLLVGSFAIDVSDSY